MWTLTAMIALGLAGCAPPEEAPTRPVVRSVVLSPGVLRAGDKVEAFVDVHDPGGQPVTLRYAWSIDGVVVQRGPSPVLGASLEKHTVIRVTVTPVSGSRVGEPARSAALEVLNTAPVGGRVEVTPALPRAFLQPLGCALVEEPSDADGDALAWSVTWTRAGEPVTDGLETAALPGDTVPAERLVEGDTWACHATIDDREIAVLTPEDRVVVATGVRPWDGLPVAGVGASCVLAEGGEPTCWGEPRLAEPGHGPYARVWLGGRLGCGLRRDALTLACWGDDLEGPPDGVFVDAAVGRDHGCAVRRDRRVVCWGRDQHGETRPPPALRARALQAQGDTTCALDLAGHVVCWGDDIGAEAVADVSFVQLAISSEHGCGLRTDGALRCFGRDASGEATPPPGPWISVGAGLDQTCGLAQDGVVRCWGQRDDAFALQAETLSMGSGDHFCARTPSGTVCRSLLPHGLGNYFGQDVAPEREVRALAVGDRGACVLDRAWRPSCFGVWTRSDQPGEPLVAIAAGADLACGLRRADRRPVCWGSRHHERLGEPPDVALVDLAVGDGAACGHGADGLVTCWGLRAPAPPDEPLTTLRVAADYACGLRADGSIACFGVDADPYDGRLDPPGGAFVALDLTRDHACGVRVDGLVTCWGRTLRLPQEQRGDFVDVATTRGRTCAIDGDGALTCWGDALGPAVKAEPEGLHLVDVDGGLDMICGLGDHGEVACWGSVVRASLP